MAALTRARFGSGFSRPSSNRIMKSIHASGRSFSARTTGAAASALTPYEREHIGHFFGFRRGDVADFRLLATPLARVVFGIAPGGEIPAEAHRDRPRGNFRETRRNHDRRGLDGAGQTGGQRKWHVRPSDMPMTMSRTVSPDVKWRSTCRVKGILSCSITGACRARCPVTPIDVRGATAPNRDDRKMRRHETIGDAPDKEPGQSGSAMRSDDEKVRTFRSRRSCNHLGRVALQQKTHDSNSRRLGLCGQPTELLSGSTVAPRYRPRSHVCGLRNCSGTIGVNGTMTWRMVRVARLAFAIAIAVVNALRDAFEKSEAKEDPTNLGHRPILS